MTSLCRVICPADQVQFSTSVALNSLRNWFILEVWFCLFTRAQFTVFWSLSLLTFPHDSSTIFILLKWSAVQTTYYTTCLCLPDDNYCLWRNMSSMAYSIESDQAIIPPSTCSNWNYLSINQTSLLAGVGLSVQLLQDADTKLVLCISLHVLVCQCSAYMQSSQSALWYCITNLCVYTLWFWILIQ